MLEKTLKRYSYIFDRFAEFAETCAIIEDLDELETLEALIQEFRDAENLSKNLHQRLVTATEFYMPRFKGRLKVCKEALRGRHRQEPAQHTKASTSRIVFLFAATLAGEGRSRVGVGLILQCQTGLRPDELTDIRVRDLSVPSSNVEPILVALGMRAHTKARREQFVSVTPDRHLESYTLLLMLVEISKSDDDLLFPFSYWIFHSSIRELDIRYGLSIGLSGHSGRACFATECISIHKMSIQETMREGRWLSETNFRMYVDVVGASSAQTSFLAKGLTAPADFCRKYFTSYITRSALSAEAHGVARPGPKAVKLGRRKGHGEDAGGQSPPYTYTSDGTFKNPDERLGEGSGSHGKSQPGYGICRGSRPEPADSAAPESSLFSTCRAKGARKDKGKGKRK